MARYDSVTMKKDPRNTLYFAYGSNLNIEQFARRCPGHHVVGRAIARGYRLAFPRYASDWQSAVAGIEMADGHHVEGAVYEIHDGHIATLDVYEGLEDQHYLRSRVHVEFDDGAVLEVMTYFANPEPAQVGPNERYVRTMIRGAKDHGLSEQWIRMLEAMLERG